MGARVVNNIELGAPLVLENEAPWSSFHVWIRVTVCTMD